MLVHKTSLSKFYKTEIILGVFSSLNDTKQEIKN